MKRFHHHPDNKIIIETDECIYIDSIENFQLDSGEIYIGIPEGFKERLYIQGKSHLLTDFDNEAFPQTLDFPYGDQFIDRAFQLVAQQVVRTTPVPPAPVVDPVIDPQTEPAGDQ